MALEGLGQAPAPAKPGKGSLDHHHRVDDGEGAPGWSTTGPDDFPNTVYSTGQFLKRKKNVLGV